MRMLGCICCCYYMLIITLRAEPPFAFLSEEEKRRLCLNHIKPFRLPQLKRLHYSVFFSLVKLSFFEFLKKFIRQVNGRSVQILVPYIWGHTQIVLHTKNPQG